MKQALLIGLMCLVLSGICNAEEVSVNSSYGVIRDQWASDDQNTRHVIIIEDAHCNYEVQNNIMNMLKDFLADERSKLFVGVEGGLYGEIDTNTLRVMNDKKKDRDYVFQLLQEGKVCGVEYLHFIRGGDFTLFGVEDPEIYSENVKGYKEYIKVSDQQRQDIEKIESILKSIKDLIMPQHYKDFDDRYNTFLKTHHPRFIGQLKQMIALYDVRGEEGKELKKYFEIEKNLSRLDQDRLQIQIQAFNNEARMRIDKNTSTDNLPETAKNTLNKYMELKKNAVLMSMIDNLDFEELLTEIEKVTDRIASAMLSRDEEHALLRHVQDIDILLNLMNLQLTPEEFDVYATTFSQENFEKLLAFIRRYKSRFKVSLRYDGLFKDREYFYSTARKRDGILADNILKAAQEQALGADDTIVLVVGGFHSPGVVTRLKENGISYTLIRPIITNVSADTQKKYFRVMKEAILP